MESSPAPRRPRVPAASPPDPRRARRHRAVEIAVTVLATVTITVLVLGGLAFIGLWLVIYFGMNNVGSNK